MENVIYLDHRVADCAAVGVPDRRLGEVVAVAVVAKDAFKGQLEERAMIEESAKKYGSPYSHKIR